MDYPARPTTSTVVVRIERSISTEERIARFQESVREIEHAAGVKPPPPPPQVDKK